MATSTTSAQTNGWPPAPDPQWVDGEVLAEPDPGEPLHIAGFSMPIPNYAPGWDPAPNIPAWLAKAKGSPEPQPGCIGYGGIHTDISVGDVDNDGVADDVVITMAGEAVLAAKMVLDPATGYFRLDPLWFWLTPYAAEGGWLNGTPSYPTAQYSCYSSHRNNPVIWNIVDDELGTGANPDSTNEVAFVGLEDNGTFVGVPTLFILRTDPSDPRNVSVVAKTALADQGKVEHRIGICRIRETDFPRDLVLTQHDSGGAHIWQELEGAQVTGLQHRFSADFDNGSLQPLTSKAHEYNWVDIDGDGFDELFQNGLIDFVDRDAATGAIVEYGVQGTRRWQMVDSGFWGDDGDGAHVDAMAVGDFDPLRPGLEVLAAMDEDPSWAGGSWKQWLATGGTIDHDDALDTLWDADCGTLLSTWSSAPSEGGQTVFAGNWSSAEPGLESISSPKDAGITIPPGQDPRTASYATAIRVTPDPTDDLDFELMAISGLIYHGPTLYDEGNDVLARSIGPWREIFPVDWNGDYASDEILQHAGEAQPLSLFRMGHKDELSLGPWPYGVPDFNQVQDSPVIQPPEDDPGCAGPDGAWIFYYQGDCGGTTVWNWVNNGPGLGTHFYEKLKATYPELESYGHPGESYGALVAKPFDVEVQPGLTPPFGLGDYREEIVAVSRHKHSNNEISAALHIFYNDTPLPAGTLVRPSPNESITYAKLRQTQPTPPIYFAEDAVTIDRFWVQPVDTGLPERVVGMPPLGTVVFEAYVEFSNGEVSEVTTLANFVQDPHSAGHLALSGSSVTSLQSDTMSGRFHAEIVVDGELLRSEPSYVFVSNTDEPVVLRAGYLDTWLVDDSVPGSAPQDDRPLRIQAFVGHRDNRSDLEVYALQQDGSPWAGIQLKDDGLGEDSVAGDGVFTAVVQDPGLANLGAPTTLYTPLIRAFVPPVSLGTPVQGAVDSKPWPYAYLGGSSAPPWPTTIPPVMAPGIHAWEAPRIASIGYRGWHVPNQLLVEVVLEDSPYRPGDNKQLLAYTNGSFVSALNHEGGNIYTFFTSHSLQGMTILDIVPWSEQGGDLIHGDAGSRLSFHEAGFPLWDVDDPVECAGGEPAGW